MQISLTMEAQPFKKQDIDKSLCGPYDDRLADRYATFAYDRGATLQKNTTSPCDPYDGWPATKKQ